MSIYLTAEDIYDFYGIAFALKTEIDDNIRKNILIRLDNIHSKYINVLKKRIIAEAKFLGLEAGMSIAQMIDKIIRSEENLKKEIASQTTNMLSIGSGFNIAGMLAEARAKAGAKLTNTEKQFLRTEIKTEKKSEIDPDSFIKDKKWKIIAEAFIKVEEARSAKEKILAIDHLNQLAHNSFSILIDLQSGRMLDNKGVSHQEAVKVVHDVLDRKFKAETPLDFVDGMSKEMSEIVKKSYKKWSNS